MLSRAAEVLPGLYVGPVAAAAAHGPPWTAVLSCGVPPPAWACDSTPVAALTLTLRDEGHADLIAVLPAAVAFVAAALGAGAAPQRVLVHCQQGISRSPAVLAGCLMALCGVDARTAAAVVSRARTVASPNAGFVAQLDVWQQLLMWADAVGGATVGAGERVAAAAATAAAAAARHTAATACLVDAVQALAAAHADALRQCGGADGSRGAWPPATNGTSGHAQVRGNAGVTAAAQMRGNAGVTAAEFVCGAAAPAPARDDSAADDMGHSSARRVSCADVDSAAAACANALGDPAALVAGAARAAAAGAAVWSRAPWGRGSANRRLDGGDGTAALVDASEDARAPKVAGRDGREPSPSPLPRTAAAPAGSGAELRRGGGGGGGVDVPLPLIACGNDGVQPPPRRPQSASAAACAPTPTAHGPPPPPPPRHVWCCPKCGAALFLGDSVLAVVVALEASAPGGAQPRGGGGGGGGGGVVGGGGGGGGVERRRRPPRGATLFVEALPWLLHAVAADAGVGGDGSDTDDACVCGGHSPARARRPSGGPLGRRLDVSAPACCAPSLRAAVARVPPRGTGRLHCPASLGGCGCRVGQWTAGGACVREGARGTIVAGFPGFTFAADGLVERGASV